MIQLRNTQTGEIRPVEEGSAEFESMRQSRRHADDRPLWEQTGTHDVLATAQRLEQGEGKTTDVPDGGQPVSRIGHGDPSRGGTFGPDFSEPTPGEASQGAGRAADDADAPEDITAPALDEEDVADAVAEGGTPAGGDESPEVSDVLDEGLTLGDTGEAPGPGYGSQEKDDLEDQARSRGVYDSIEGTGANGNILKGDIVRALEADDASNAEASDDSEEEAS